MKETSASSESHPGIDTERNCLDRADPEIDIFESFSSMPRTNICATNRCLGLLKTVET